MTTRYGILITIFVCSGLLLPIQSAKAHSLFQNPWTSPDFIHIGFDIPDLYCEDGETTCPATNVIPVILRLEVLRIRYTTFQYSVGRLHYGFGWRADDGRAGVGVLGVGHHWRITDSYIHELGYLFWPLSVVYAHDGVGGLLTQIYYRNNGTTFPIEIGLDVPLTCCSNSQEEYMEREQGMPLHLYLKTGF
jgi:hypothetical protein